MKERLVALVIGMLLGAGALVAVGQGGKGEESPAMRIVLGETQTRVYALGKSLNKPDNPLPTVKVGEEYLRLATRPAWTGEFLEAVSFDYQSAKTETKSAAQASQIADEATYKLQMLIAAQNARALVLLEKIAAEKK